MRLPDLRLVQPVAPETLRDVTKRWRASRVDVSDGTKATHEVNAGRFLPTLGHRTPASIAPADVADLVAKLHDDGLARESVRKTVSTLAQVLDFGKVAPNPARDSAVKLPREDTAEVCPPTATHVEAVHRILAPSLRLPLIVLDATGMRIGELEALTWGDVDETSGRWRVSKATSKTRRARWVPVAELVFDAVTELVPREDRDLGAQVFSGFAADRFRTALGRACKAAGVPAMSPHDLRHRRATLWHLTGVPPADAAAWLGHSPVEHLRTYAHATLTDRREIDTAKLLERARTVHTAVIPTV